MAGLSERFSTCLEIDCGPVLGDSRDRDPVPGEEFVATNPADVAFFYTRLSEKLESGDFQPSPEPVLRGPARLDGDPFYKLSNELIREITVLLPYDALLSLRSASRPFYHDTLNNSFWEKRIANDMPWLWDLEASFGDWTEQIDYRKLYAWLEVVTKPKFGIEVPFLAIANRRRIWQCCLEILNHTQDVLDVEYVTDLNPDMVAQARRPILFKVAPTEASREDDISRTFWLHSDKELQANRFGTFLFESFWNEDDLLIGFGVVFGNRPRFFGTRSGKEETVRLIPGDWIADMAFFFATQWLPKGRLYTGIKEIHVQPQSGFEFNLGMEEYGGDCRRLCVPEGKCLVGVEGQVRPVCIDHSGLEVLGSISYRTVSSRESMILWAHDVRDVCDFSPIWKRPDIKMTPIFPLTLGEGFPEESLNPYYPLPWAKAAHGLAKPIRVKTYTPRDPDDTTRRLILGLKAEFAESYGETERYVGQGGNWPEDETTIFDLHYPFDERIVEIGVSKSETLKGIMLKTNWVRSVIFGQGEPGPENWTMVRVPDGEYISGIAATFDTDPTTGVKGAISSLVMLHTRFIPR
ncbi:hypothetical protein NCS52_00836800 [Fusarium sp. LHS14.1]|nr:hypothetical protein NCS52_00836800 [Fusarium sp. LHS14.1]